METCHVPQSYNQDVSGSTWGVEAADQPQQGQRIEHPSSYDSGSTDESLSESRCRRAHPKPHASKGTRPGNDDGAVVGYSYSSYRRDDDDDDDDSGGGGGGSHRVASASKSYIASVDPDHDEKSTRAEGGGRDSARGNDDEVASSARNEGRSGMKGLRRASYERLGVRSSSIISIKLEPGRPRKTSPVPSDAIASSRGEMPNG